MLRNVDLEKGNVKPQAQNIASWLFLQIKLYWNIAMAIHLHIVCRCIPIFKNFFTMAELNRCNRNHMAHRAKSIYSLALYRKFPTSCSTELNARKWKSLQTSNRIKVSIILIKLFMFLINGVLFLIRWCDSIKGLVGKIKLFLNMKSE